MIAALTWILLCQLAGEIIVLTLALPVPGPVVGLALLFGALVWRGGPSPTLRTTAQGLLQHLSLLFVPAGVGVMLHIDRLAAEWLPLGLALLLSTLITLLVTAFVLRRLRGPEEVEPK